MAASMAKGFWPCITLLSSLFMTIITAQTVPTISTVGSKFFFSNGTQYYVKGMPSPFPLPPS